MMEGLMRLPLIILFSAILLTSIWVNSKATADPLGKSIFQITKPDTAIKPLVFPQAMMVMQS